MTTVLQTLAEYGAAQTGQSLTGDVMHHAKRAIIDWFAALYPGTRVAPATLMVRAHAAELGVGTSTVVGFDTTTFPATAAWINGTASHTVEFDDIFKDAAYHPGCPTIAGALAIGEQLGASGSQLLNAVTVGYEISTRVGAAVQPSHYRYFHTTGTAGCLGSAAACAVLLAPGKVDVLRDALANATTFASGLQQAFRSDSMTKPLHAGHAAMIGVNVAKAAACGVTGAPDMLEGEAGFGAALADEVDWTTATRGLGQHFNITEITQKNHGCCGHTFAAIDAMLILRQQFGQDMAESGPIDWQQIELIEVHTYQVALDVTGNLHPRSAPEAKFSLAYVICHAWIHGSVRLDAFADERLADPSIRELMRKVRLSADPELSRRFPGQRAARVRVVLKDGRRLEHFAPYRKGDPEAPLSDDEINAKYIELVAPVLGAAAARTLLDRLWGLDGLLLKDLELR